MRVLAVSPNSEWVASGSSDSTIILWDTRNGAIVQQWVAHSYMPVWSLAFSPDSQFLVSGGNDRNAVVWSHLNQGPRKVATLEGHAAIVSKCSWSPDGNTIATGSWDGTMRLWDAHTFQQRALHPLKGDVIQLAFSPDGYWITCVSDKGEASILNVALGTLHKSLWSHPSDNDDDDPRVRALRPGVSPYAVSSAAFDPRSTCLAIAPYKWGPRMNIVDLETGNMLLPKGGDGMGVMDDISISLDGRLVLGATAKAIYIWEASTGVELFQLEGHKKKVQEARFSPCGKYIASALSDRTVQLWRVNDGSCVATLSEHEDWVRHVAFAPDGKTLSSGGWDGRVFIRHMHDIILHVDGQDNGSLNTPNSPSFVDPIPNYFHFPLP